MKRIIPAILILALCVTALPAAALADHIIPMPSLGGSGRDGDNTQPSTISLDMPGTGIVSTVSSTLTLREGPDGTYKKLADIPRGSEITLIESAAVNGTTWYKTYYNGFVGWVSGAYVRVTRELGSDSITTVPESLAPNEFNEYGLVYGKPSSTVNVRIGPGTENMIITQINESMTVRITGEEQSSDGVIWYKVEIDGIDGFASSNYITKIETDINLNTSVVTDTCGIGTVTASSLTVRKGAATTYSSSGSLSKDTRIGIFGGQMDADGREWYRVSANGKSGYVLSDHVRIDTVITKCEQAFEDHMNKQGFPESYKPMLRVLHNLYPSWEFIADYIKEDFTVAAAEQYAFGDMLPSGWGGTQAVSLIDKTSPVSWLSRDPGAYNAQTGTYISGWDGDNWLIPSKEIVKYYLDPRNFLTTDDIFSFLDLSYKNDQSSGTVAAAAPKLSAGWLGSSSFTHTTDGTTINYAQTIADAGRNNGINPVALVSIITQELGTESTALNRPQISGIQEGTYSGITDYYKGWYNYFNIGAYVSSSFNKAYLRGLSVARSYGWNTREKAIDGGAKYFADKYVKANQMTFYYFRFNVLSNKLAHQFSTDLQEAASWGKLLSKAYSDSMRTAADLTFRIPVYKNMPAARCAVP